jgi:hypothetical protein
MHGRYFPINIRGVGTRALGTTRKAVERHTSNGSARPQTAVDCFVAWLATFSIANSSTSQAARGPARVRVSGRITG